MCGGINPIIPHRSTLAKTVLYMRVPISMGVCTKKIIDPANTFNQGYSSSWLKDNTFYGRRK